MTTPTPTKLVLGATLALTAGVVVLFIALLADDEEIGSSFAGAWLLLPSLLFALRVGGQVVAILSAPTWLPRMESGQWNLMPYRLLFPIQLVFLVVMAWVVVSLLTGSGAAAEPAPDFGRFLIGFAVVYAGAMATRYVMRMRRQPEQRWFGGTIPIVFHFVLASFLFVLGSYHASH
jgi:uncharacterized protein